MTARNLQVAPHLKHLYDFLLHNRNIEDIPNCQPAYLQIFAQAWEPTIPQPKAVVCLVHGLGEHTSRYAHVAEALGREGYILFGADLRGHGRSGGARGHISSIEDFMKDVDVSLEQARLRYPGLPIILYGHSLGGIQVLYYGLTRKPNVKGVIATSSGLHTHWKNNA